MFRKKAAEPPKPRWTVSHGLEANRGRMEMVVYVHTDAFDPRYPSSTGAHREVIGYTQPDDREAISGLIARATMRCVELAEAEAYAEAALGSLS